MATLKKAMPNVTYLLGAGASFDALPIVENFSDDIEQIIKKLKQYEKFLQAIPAPKDSKQILEVAIRHLLNIYEGCKQHRSIDTYARRLYLTLEKKNHKLLYEELKCGIVLFFELYRFFYSKVDMRYDAFLATILAPEEPYLPGNINILSWNYDYEFERAYLNYSVQDKDINQVYNDLNVIHKNSNNNISLSSKFGILKLNGTAGFFNKDRKIILGLNHPNLTIKGSKSEDFNRLHPLIKNYCDYYEDESFEPSISFSWEKEVINEGFLEQQVVKALSDTDIIVVIGYSFPYFNRKMDSLIMNSFSKYHSGKVYVQDPKSQQLLDTVIELRNSWKKYTIGGHFDETRFIAKTGIDQFYMSF